MRDRLSRRPPEPGTGSIESDVDRSDARTGSRDGARRPAGADGKMQGLLVSPGNQPLRRMREGIGNSEAEFVAFSPPGLRRPTAASWRGNA